ncbi:hypothetical protein PVAP13_6KG291406 [Panicum virgatum]|uniref:Uncharacterized protein n=1 Tax=Panicum virgatum TaxID=38727 RepID=A0A8T0RGY3_PANVG|nr:hypothetical protein PVAP13_6KG291406 [Panicum virgatum]
MSDDLYFQVFYGSGEVRYGPEGVDLSEDRTWISISNWLFKAFGLSRDEHVISVMTVVSRREPIFWELLPLEGTQNWRNYVNISSCRGLPLVLFVQAFGKISFRIEAGGDYEGQGDIVSEETETMHEPHEEGATGQANEEENIPEIVEEFQRESEQQHNAMNDVSSDDDDDDDYYHVPHNWSGYDFSKLSVNEGEAVPWEYRQNEVCIGLVYANSDNMKEAIKRWSTLFAKTVQSCQEQAIKTFSEWIEHEPKEKWVLLFDEGGARYGLMTTNLAEVYNWVLRGVRSLPLVGIVEFFLYRTCDWLYRMSVRGDV